MSPLDLLVVGAPPHWVRECERDRRPTLCRCAIAVDHIEGDDEFAAVEQALSVAA